MTKSISYALLGFVLVLEIFTFLAEIFFPTINKDNKLAKQVIIAITTLSILVFLAILLITLP